MVKNKIDPTLDPENENRAKNRSTRAESFKMQLMARGLFDQPCDVGNEAFGIHTHHTDIPPESPGPSAKEPTMINNGRVYTKKRRRIPQSRRM
jgi:hypothetical protein